LNYLPIKRYNWAEMKSIYRKLTEAGVDKKDIEIMDFLASEKKFTEKDYEEIGQKVGLPSSEVKARLNNLKEKKILLKDRVSILDQVRIWDGYYIVLVKAAIQPPVIGMETKFPTGWVIKNYIEGIKQVEKEMGIDIVRHAYNLQGIEWDIMLIVSAKTQSEYIEFLGKVAKQGWISKGWSITPVELGGEWIFDPISSPKSGAVKEIKEKILIDK
jgi:DNA-binding Lrp family transcriptional regulator